MIKFHVGSKKKESLLIYYIMLFTVIITWGSDPVINSHFYKYFSASMLCTVCTFVSALFFWIINFKKIKFINSEYIKIAVPIGLLNALANLSQRIGLQYTTPTNYAFLEYSSVAVVPIALYFMTRKKPSVIQITAAGVCIVGCFLFSGMSFHGFNLGVGEVLCTLAGVLGGICCAATGVYVKKLDVMLYITIYMTVYFLTSLGMTIGLNAIVSPVTHLPLEPLRFSVNIPLLFILAVFGLFSVGLCWLLRTEAIKHISPAKVIIISPFSAILTGVISIFMGTDIISVRFVLGAILILCAAIVSGLDDISVKSEREISKR